MTLIKSETNSTVYEVDSYTWRVPTTITTTSGSSAAPIIYHSSPASTGFATCVIEEVKANPQLRRALIEALFSKE